MVCPPVHGDNPRALASGLSPVQSGNLGITIIYHLFIIVDLAHYAIFRAKVGMGGINCFRFWSRRQEEFKQIFVYIHMLLLSLLHYLTCLLLQTLL